MSENRTKSGIDTCKNGICNVSVLSKLNEEGDIETDIHLNVITKVESNFETYDIPIVDGVRGVENTYDRSSDLPSLGNSRSLAYLYSIPQVRLIMIIIIFVIATFIGFFFFINFHSESN